jgi:hypothetical protein
VTAFTPRHNRRIGGAALTVLALNLAAVAAMAFADAAAARVAGWLLTSISLTVAALPVIGGLVPAPPPSEEDPPHGA